MDNHVWPIFLISFTLVTPGKRSWDQQWSTGKCMCVDTWMAAGLCIFKTPVHHGTWSGVEYDMKSILRPVLFFIFILIPKYRRDGLNLQIWHKTVVIVNINELYSKQLQKVFSRLFQWSKDCQILFNAVCHVMLAERICSLRTMYNQELDQPIDYQPSDWHIRRLVGDCLWFEEQLHYRSKCTTQSKDFGTSSFRVCQLNFIVFIYSSSEFYWID